MCGPNDTTFAMAPLLYEGGGFLVPLRVSCHRNFWWRGCTFCQRHEAFGTTIPNAIKSRPNPNLKYTNCNRVGHTVERCFDLIRYPPNYKKLGSQNANKYYVNNAIVDPSPSTTPVVSFSNEQMLKLLSLIDDKFVSSSVANMTGTFS